MREARGMQDAENHGATTLSVQDDMGPAQYKIYIYNILDREWVLNMPPQFGTYRIPACKKGEPFAYNIMSAFVNEVYTRTGTTELYYKKVDGRKYATSLLNPAAYPGIQWEAQLHNWNSLDQFGNNLNKLGCFWSLTRPDEVEKLQVEIKLFKDRATETMQQLVKDAEQLADAGQRNLISPLMHFAMDYLGITSGWHTSLTHKISCPNCGELVNEGIAYHKNAFGEKCIIDFERYEKMISLSRPKVQLAEEDDAEEIADIPAAPKKGKRKVAG